MRTQTTKKKKETRQGPLKLSAFPRRVKDPPPLPKGDSPPNTILRCGARRENVRITATLRATAYGLKRLRRA